MFAAQRALCDLKKTEKGNDQKYATDTCCGVIKTKCRCVELEEGETSLEVRHDEILQLGCAANHLILVILKVKQALAVECHSLHTGDGFTIVGDKQHSCRDIVK